MYVYLIHIYVFIYVYIHIYTYICIYTVSPRPKSTFCGDYRSQSVNAKPTQNKASQNITGTSKPTPVPVLSVSDR